MTKATSANLALVGPKRPPAAVSPALPSTPVERFSLDGYLAAASAPDFVVLCPGGVDLEADIAFLRSIRRRLLWPGPPPGIADAIAGLVTGAPAGRRRPGPRRRGCRSAALLLEGVVTAERARAALRSPERLWIVESARRVRLSEADFAQLERAGVRWSALHPVEVVGVLAGAALRAARPRWRRLVPASAAVWPMACAPRSRRPSPR